MRHFLSIQTVGSITILKDFRIINFAATIAFKRNNNIIPTRFGRLSNHQHRYAASVSVSLRDSTQDCPNLLLQNDLARQRPNDSFHNSVVSMSFINFSPQRKLKNANMLYAHRVAKLLNQSLRCLYSAQECSSTSVRTQTSK